jgi:hypothetical protein
MGLLCVSSGACHPGKRELRCRSAGASCLGLSSDQALEVPGNREWSGYRSGATFIGLERDFLREHDIARNQMADRQKASPCQRMAGRIQLDHIRGHAIMDAISLPGVAADDLEIIPFAELFALLGRQPVLQQPQASRVRAVAAQIQPVQGANGPPPRPLVFRGVPKRQSH